MYCSRADRAPASMPRVSVFLAVPEAEWVCSNALAFAFRDRHPVSPGHTLVVSRRPTEDWFSATEPERQALLQLVARVKQQLDEQLHPGGYNVGFNTGVAAGQRLRLFVQGPGIESIQDLAGYLESGVRKR
jgi:hypothetical protein